MSKEEFIFTEDTNLIINLEGSKCISKNMGPKKEELFFAHETNHW